MDVLVQTGQYYSINTTNTGTMGYYVIKFMSEPYILQEETMYNGKISTAGEIVIKYQYINCMQYNTRLYWEQNHNISISFPPHSQLYIHVWM